MNPLRELLDQVLATGQLPDDDQIAAVVTRGPSIRERHEARRGIRVEAARIVSALGSNLPDQAEQAADNAAEQYAAFAGDTATPGPRDLAAGVPRTRTHAPERPTPRTAGAEPLRQLLTSAVRVGVRASDLDRLETRPDAAAGEVSAWRRDVLAASRTISSAYQSGQQALARRLVDEHATRFADMIAQPDQRDPHEDLDDPRELAGLVPRDRGHR